MLCYRFISNLPDEVVPAIRQIGVNIIGIYEYYIYRTLIYIFYILCIFITSHYMFLG